MCRVIGDNGEVPNSFDSPGYLLPNTEILSTKAADKDACRISCEQNKVVVESLKKFKLIFKVKSKEFHSRILAVH